MNFGFGGGKIWINFAPLITKHGDDMALTACRGGKQACRAIMAMLYNLSH